MDVGAKNPVVGSSDLKFRSFGFRPDPNQELPKVGSREWQQRARSVVETHRFLRTKTSTMARNRFCTCLLLSLAAILGPLALVGAIEAIPQAADTVTMVNADSPKDVRLEANLAIPDGGELVLSIQVPHEAVKLHSHGPAKVTRVYSDHADGKYGVGEVIHIFVEFTSAVQIVGKGAPWLLLHTGCHDSPCHVREVQRLRCQATKGKFALAFDGQKVGNVPWDATQKVLAAYIQRMTRIDKVSVEYSIDEGRACTFFGNNITITYESMNIAGTDGDLSEMIGDSNNLVGDGVVLEHIQYPPAISATAWELQKGVLIPDRRAQFVAQTAPNTLQFAYTVQRGDNTSRLEYANSDSLALSLRAAGGARILNADESQIQVNAILPPPGFAGDWERGLGSSLSTHNALTINVSPPYVTTVTSPHVDGTFGIGEEILVHVHFSQPIVVSGLPTVVLETGTVDRIIPFSQVLLPERTIAEFRYIVQSMDTSPDLTYTSTDALQLNGGSIKRQSTTPTTSTILKLPANGESGSLSVNKNIVIDTTNPQVQSVSTTAAGGTYTAGDEIPIVITFDVPVVVTGTPQLLLNTGTVNLFPGEFVQAAPTLSSAKTVIFPSVDHGLTTLLSRGLQFQIGGQILTVDYVNGDEVTMLEDYTATVVDPRNIVGRANIPIKTPGYRPANYNSGSGTTSLVFVYVVQVGDVSTRLDYVSTAALQVGSGSIKRLSSTPFMAADITLDVPGTVGSLGFGSSIMVNTDAPVVSRVTAKSRNGVYKAGDSIDFEVEFNLAVVVFPTASVLTNVGTGGIERFAVYAKGSGSKNLKFRFQCIAADDAAVFDYVGVKALLFASWTEVSSATSTWQIRVKSFDFQQFPPLSSFEDGGGSSSILSFPLGLDASAPNLVVFASKLYLLWEEANSATNNPTQIFVAVLSSRANGGSAAQWTIVDNTPTDSSGINKVPTENAAAPHGVAHNSKLYTAWHENAGGIPQIRVAVYNGLDVTPGWTFVDGNQLARGLNYDASKSAGKVQVNTPGSLDFTHSIQVETSVPVVESMHFIGEMESAVTLVNMIQTIDVFNTGSLTQGEYKLIYGHLSETPCIDWDAPASGVGSVEAALNSIVGLALTVSVVKDASAFLDGHRYIVTFAFPSMGLQSLQPKRVPDTSCKAFVCLPTALLPCNIGLVQTNQNADVRVGVGIVDTVVYFSFPVEVQIGIPKLTLDAGTADRDAVYSTRSALQEFDVGVDSASSLLAGAFRLSYGDFSNGVGAGTIITTDCIQILPNDEDGIQEIQAKLEAIALLNTIGIRTATRRKVRNGYRYGIEFRNSGDLLDLVPADSTDCLAVSGRIQTIDISADSEILAGEILVQLGDATSSCISWDLRAKGSTNSMEAFLSSMDNDRIIPLQIVKDPSAFAYGFKYYVSFMLRDDAKQPLIVSSDAACVAFTCDDGNGASTTCSGLSIAANADFRVSRAASEALSFRYLVQSSDETASLTYKNSLSLTGSIVRASMSPTVAALLTLPQPRDALLSEPRASSVSIVSINTIPVVVRVSSTTLDDTYTAGDVILVLVEFSGTVEVDGKPILELDSNGKAFFVSGGATSVLKFYYKVEAGDTSSDLNYASEAALRTFTTPESRIRCGLCSSLLIDASLALPSLLSVSSLAANSALIIDTTIPTIVEISSSRPDTVAGDAGYGPGDILDIIVEFSADVVVSGIPTLSLNSGGTAAFTYAGYRQLIDVGVNAVAPVTSGQFSIVYNGESSGCIDFDDADSSASTSLKSQLLEFPTIARIGVMSVTLTRKKNGNRFVILFDSTKVVDVPMAIGLALSDVCEPLYPSSTAPELLVSRSTDRFVVFHYTVEAGETAALLNAAGIAISLAGGDKSIKRRAGSPIINADLTLPDPTGPHGLAQKKHLAIDGAEVKILDIVSDSAAQTYGVAFPSTASPPTVGPGEVLFHLVFSRPVKVIGSPTVELATGSLRPNGEFIPNRLAKFAGQPQPDHVAFLYHVEAEDYSSNLAFANRNGLADAEIYCVASTMAVRATTLLPRFTVSDSSIIEIDAYSVPTTVKLASSQGDGVYGAGELIEIQVTFSKQVVLLTGLNHNLDWHARYPIALEVQNWIYIMWTECDDLHTPTKSYLYVRVFTSGTLDVVPMVSTSPINRSPDTFIEKVTMTIWLGDIYAAWDEGGLLYCAQFEGVTSPFPWTLIPNMGVNKDMEMTASDPVLIVYNLELVVIWRELAVPVGGTNPVGHIHVAVRNDDNNAPLWIFHDGNQLQSGLNKDALMDADDPTAVVYRGRLYVSWSEMNEAGAYEIVIARRNVQTRDFSTWTYLEALPSTYPAYTFLSAYHPQLAVRRKGLEDMALLITWYRDTTISNFSEVITGQVLDLDWEASVTGSNPQTINAAELNSSIDGANPNTKQQQFLTCGDSVYASWLGLEGASSEESAYVVKLATLPSGSDVYTDWTAAGIQYNLNQNPKLDAMDSFLVCSSSTSANPQVGLVWTEYDGYSMKLRFRHSSIVPRIPGISANSFGEVTAGAPILLLATQSNPTGFATCINMSGLTAYTLTFAYVVQPGESTPNLEILGSDALRLNGGEIRDVYGQTPDFTLFPDSTDLRSLAYNSQLAIDTTPPTVSGVTTVNPSGEYGVGELFLLQVAFTNAVIVFEGDLANIPTLHLRSDELHQMTDSQGLATYTGGSGTNVLTFEYTTTQQDYCERFDYLDSGSLSLNGEGWTVKRKSTRPIVDAILTLPTPKSTHSLSGNRLIAIKPTQPRVLSVSSSTPDGVYYPGDTILVDVVFSLPVVVFGFPVLLLATGDEGTRASLTSGNESATLTFQYDIKKGDSSARLDVMDDRHGNGQVYFVMSLELAGSSEIKRVSTSPYTSAILALPAPGLAGSLSANKNIVVDSTPPAVLDIRSPVLDGTYDVGETIDILMKFSRRVVVIGTPELILNVPALATRTAVYIDGSETDTLWFSYTPEEGDNSMNVALDFQNEYSLILRPLLDGMEFLQAPAQIIGLSANPMLAVDIMLPLPGVAVRADAVLSLVGNNQKIFVRTDGFHVQGVVADVPNGVYSPGQRIVISVLFTGPAVVQGVPQIKLNANALSFAMYFGGTGTAQLQFEYIVATGDSCSVLEAASRSALELNGGVISDSKGIYAPLRLRAPLLPGSLSYEYRLEISSTPPVVERVYCQNGDGDYGVGDVLHLTVQFSRKVVIEDPAVASTPSLKLLLDTGFRTANYLTGDGTNTLVFSIQVVNGDSAHRLDYADDSSLSGIIYAMATTPTTQVNLLLPTPGVDGSLSDSSAVRVISTPPTVESVTAVSRNGTYGLNDQLYIRVHFSFPVLVTTASSCLLKLSVGDLERRRAVYTGGSTTKILTFVYTVEFGDHSAHLDYADSESLTCSVLQSTAVPSLSASPLLALPGASASLGFSSAFRIDASSPRIVSVSSDLPNGVYGAGQVIDISVAFSEAVLVTKGGIPRLRLAIASNAVVDALLETAVEPFATYIGGSGTATLRFTYTTREGDMALPLMYAGIDALSMVPEGVQVTAAAIGQSAFRFATLRLPAPGATGSFSNNRDIHIDTLEPPRVLSVGSPMPDRIYTAGDTLELSVAFSMPVTVIGTAPTLLLQTGNVESSDGEKKAIYVSGSGTSVLLFEYEIQVGDRTDRLDYRPCPFAERRAPERREWDKLVICSSAANALQLEGTSGSVKRTSTFPTTDAVLNLPEVTDWAQVRFQTSHDEVVYVTQLEPTTDIPEADRTLSQPLVNEFTMTQERTAITMYSNGIPDHKTTLLERLKEQRYLIELQRFPTQQSNPLVLSEVPDKFTGIFLNGIPFKSLSSSEQATDDCGGAIDADNRYFYVTLPLCYLAMAHEPREAPASSQVSTSNSRPPSIVVAYALDGFPIYGFYNEDGELPGDLDECNGRVRRDGQYGYHLVPPDTPSASPFMPCSKGIDATSASQDQLEVFRYPADVAAVEGLSLSRLSRLDGLVIDETSTAEHATTWLNPDGVSVVYTSTSVIVRSTGVPPTGSYGPFPNAYNRFIVSEQDYVFQFSRHPMVSATTTPLPLDVPIGVLLNGVPFFASDSEIYGGNVLDSANPAYVLMDRCNGLVDAGGDYRYYASPDCLLDQLGDVADQPSPLLGFAFDGFPLYGPYDENGQIPDDLDVCNGRTGDDGTYRYHVTLTSPYLLGCFRGELSTDETGDLYRSLSYAHALRINTDRPRVAHVFTNKRPGTYVAGESIDVVVEWSTPVQIDWAGGLPSLVIQNSPRVAIYDPSRSSATSSSFMFMVTSGDFDIEDFSYDPHVPIQLNGARIARLAAFPVLDADLKLVPIDLDDTNLIRTGTSGLASKFQLVRSLHVELRGMYHPRAADLRARVFHGRRQSIIFDGCCTPRDAFGIPDVPDVLINRAQLDSEPRNPTSGVGWDYNFADFDGLDNLALDGGATVLQSSTSGMCVASNAIDGRIRGVGVATQTVARTHPAEDEQESAWWELRLLKSHPIGTIRVWIPEREPELPAVVFTLRADASDGVSPVTGHFTLMFTAPNGHQQINTEPISHNAVAMVVDENPRATTPGIGLGESLQAKLTALGELMPRLFVTRDPRDAAMSDNGAFTWHITFLDSTRIASSVLSVGTNAVCDGTGVVELTVPSPIDDGSDPVMYRDEKAGTPTNSTGQKVSEQSMFPFWVLLFEHSAVMDVESFADAYDRAVFAYRVDGSQANRSVIAVVPSAGTIAQYVRLVAELPRGVLSLAEVEVFAEQTHVLSQYRGGTPVRVAYYPGAKTWSPEEPFKYVFGGMPSEGAWTLAIADMAANGSTNLKANATAGGISDWTLHVTNEAGETRAYFMDFQAQLHALPRHGTLFVALDGTERDHLDVDANGLLDSMEADVYLSRYSPTGYSALPALTRKRELQQFLLNYDTFGGVEVLRDPSERQKRLPSRVCDSACLQALGVDPYFYVGLEGDVALKLLRVVGDRVVKYVPQPGFRGKDAFTFSVAVGGQESRVLGTIQLTLIQQLADQHPRPQRVRDSFPNWQPSFQYILPTPKYPRIMQITRIIAHLALVSALAASASTPADATWGWLTGGQSAETPCPSDKEQTVGVVGGLDLSAQLGGGQKQGGLRGSETPCPSDEGDWNSPPSQGNWGGHDSATPCPSDEGDWNSPPSQGNWGGHDSETPCPSEGQQTPPSEGAETPCPSDGEWTPPNQGAETPCPSEEQQPPPSEGSETPCPSKDQTPPTENTEGPPTKTPETETPETETPETETPETETPETPEQGTETPVTETPVTETPSTETPATETPVTETPATETPDTPEQGTETPGTETPVTETPVTETPETPETETPETPDQQIPSTESPDVTPAPTTPGQEVPSTESPDVTPAPTTPDQEVPSTESPAVTKSPDVTPAPTTTNTPDQQVPTQDAPAATPAATKAHTSDCAM
ncbi:hypothetical protein BBJ28_00002381 [Nothophytophthora sp. Chile5]|nr:hypothetical protein BBJ28_00002381 [Nothophytophthora sp. Chile5]